MNQNPSGGDFEALPISADLRAVLRELGYEKSTPIQARTWPLLLAGKDVIGQSKTGSGKTLAFALPILEKIDLERREIQALILCPTRELCAQVAREIRKLSRRHSGLQTLILAGGEPARPQSVALQHGVHIIVGTPGRVLDHLQRGRLDFRYVKTLVLDEADRMLDMGFSEDMELILAEVPGTRQTLFFSATLPPGVYEFTKKYQHSPELVAVEEDQAQKPDITQWVCETSAEKKFSTLLRALQHYQPESAILFCNLKVTVADVARELTERGLSAAGLHGDLDQEQRNEVLAQFRNGSLRLLVATDVAARGLDIKDLPFVINYDWPWEDESYIHRIGRTARAGQKGTALSFVTREDLPRLQKVQQDLKMEFPKTHFEAEGQDFGPLREAAMATLYISGGRKEKVRPGDILGALTGDAGQLEAAQIGKIEIHDHFSYVAVSKNQARSLAERLRDGRIKGRKFFTKILK